MSVALLGTVVRLTLPLRFRRSRDLLGGCKPYVAVPVLRGLEWRTRRFCTQPTSAQPSRWCTSPRKPTRCTTTVSHSHRVLHPPPVMAVTWAAPDPGQHYGCQPLQAECLRSQGNGSGGGRIQEWNEMESLATVIHGLGPASTRCTQR
ncbi:hypothetical protein BV22DRAFT_934884 [Leucogyrophana mollusca]|uniref:Uncharacterized protein n=1 Tax=Leucogyrophana mollusca TaxID=85980 RepID=A0ACB8AY72_9AGAM|nr:hypothetical protein BV22DRAFT_934884 [Leucogyrophana mollusca]